MRRTAERARKAEIGYQALAIGGILAAAIALRHRSRAQPAASRPAIGGVSSHAPARNGAPRPAVPRRNALPRPLVRVRPRLRVIEGGAKPDPYDTLLQDLFHNDPRGGSFYQILPGDTPETIARAVLKATGRFTKQNVLDYIHCFSSSRHNLDRYGSRSTSSIYPSEWLVPSFGQGLRAAFLPRNDDALDAFTHRRLPKRTIDANSGAPLEPEAKRLGCIWLPPVSRDDLRNGIVTCGHQTYADGSSSIDPPPDFLAHLEAA